VFGGERSWLCSALLAEQPRVWCSIVRTVASAVDGAHGSAFNFPNPGAELFALYCSNADAVVGTNRSSNWATDRRAIVVTVSCTLRLADDGAYAFPYSGSFKAPIFTSDLLSERQKTKSAPNE
jgi:hypothetical protein